MPKLTVEPTSRLQARLLTYDQSLPQQFSQLHDINIFLVFLPKSRVDPGPGRDAGELHGAGQVLVHPLVAEGVLVHPFVAEEGVFHPFVDEKVPVHPLVDEEVLVHPLVDEEVLVHEPTHEPLEVLDLFVTGLVM